ncbi:MAG: hypothetical protein NTU57_02585 [Candidatus Aenigmarchaeota archaeon]|nr:hypothetical protein [Candidatus Aenigmarchaeota archaeon]
MKLQETKTGQLTVTIPRPLARAMGLKKGDELQVAINQRGNLEISKLKNQEKTE